MASGDRIDCSDGAVGQGFANKASADQAYRERHNHTRAHAAIASEQLYFAQQGCEARKEEFPPALQEAWDLLRGYLGYEWKNDLKST